MITLQICFIRDIIKDKCSIYKYHIDERIKPVLNIAYIKTKKYQT